MKQSSVLLKKLFAVLMIASFVCCGKKGITGINTQQCADKAKAVSEALNAYVASPVKANCEAYKSALQNYVNDAVGCGITTGDLSAARQAIESLSCQ
ncbi:MAG: hypothetical protein ACKVOW_10405 [Chitinophagaceae bacterium]